MHILVVDDERNIARTLALTLEGDGHEVVVAENGAAALRHAQKTGFDLVFLDLRLGREDGLEVLARLRAADPGLPVVLITAYASVPTAVEAMRRGAADYLPKPFTPDQIRTRGGARDPRPRAGAARGGAGTRRRRAVPALGPPLGGAGHATTCWKRPSGRRPARRRCCCWAKTARARASSPAPCTRGARGRGARSSP